MFEFQTVRDVILFAISLERISQRFYEDLAGRVEDRGVRAFLTEMAGQEALHEEQLNTLLAEDAGELDGPVAAEQMQSYIQAMNIPDPLDYKKAVKVAYNKENASQMLYSILAARVDTGTI